MIMMTPPPLCSPKHAGAPFDAVVAVAAVAAFGAVRNHGLGSNGQPPSGPRADRIAELGSFAVLAAFNRTVFNALDALFAHVATGRRPS